MLREINPKVYLGFIQPPSPKSISVARRNLETAVNNDSYYRENSRSIDRYADYRERNYRRWGYKNYASVEGLEKIYEKLGWNSGLHVDIRDYSAVPRIKKHAEKLGMKIKTYTINEPTYHENQLVKIKKSGNSLPHGIISDSSPYRICNLLFDISKPIKKRNYSTSDGRYVAALPSDADLERINESIEYKESGYYLNLDGKLKSIPANSHTGDISNSKQVTTRTETIKDEDMSLDNGNSIYIRVKQ